jgi:hypothetical protein
LLALLSAGFSTVLYVVLRRLIREQTQLEGSHAALISAAAWLALPVSVALLRTAGGPALLAALALGLPATLLRQAEVPKLLLAFVLSCLATWMHPLAGLVLVAAVPILIRLRAGWVALVLVLGSVAGLSANGHLLEPPVVGLEGRMSAGLATMLAAPVLALDVSSRALLATGFDWVGGRLPCLAGLACWLLLFGAAALVGRFRNAVPLMLGLVMAAALCPFVVPGWVPGDVHTVLCGLLIAAQLVGLVLAPVSAAAWPALARGLAAGLLVLAALSAFQRAPQMAVRRFALAIPHHPPALGSLLAPELEPDPVRLLLYMEDMMLVGGLKDPQTLTCGLNAKMRLSLAPPPCLDPETLRERLGQILEEPGHTPTDADPAEGWVFQKIPALEARLGEVIARISAEGYEAAWQSSADELVSMLPELAEVLTVRGRHPKIVQFQSRALDILRTMAKQATAMGEQGVSVPLRELLVDAQAREPRALAILGRELIDVGRVSEGLAALEEALGRFPEKDVLQVVSEGALVWGRLLPAAHGALGKSPDLSLLERAQLLEAVRGLDAAWARLVGGQGADARRLQQITPLESLDYWLVVEMLLRRHEVVVALKDERASQTARDVARALEASQAGGLRRLPALWMEARLALVGADSAKALRILREARALSPTTLRERGDGDAGRLLHVRWRRHVLQDLCQLLSGAEAAAERAAVEAELQSLR